MEWDIFVYVLSSHPPPHQTPAASWVSPEVLLKGWWKGERFQSNPRKQHKIQTNKQTKQAKKSETSKQAKVKASTQIKNERKKWRKKQLKSQRIGVHPPRAHRLSCTKLDPKIRQTKIQYNNKETNTPMKPDFITFMGGFRYHLSISCPSFIFFGGVPSSVKVWVRELSSFFATPMAKLTRVLYAEDPWDW